MINKDINLNITSIMAKFMEFYLEEKMYHSNVLFKGIVIFIFLLVIKS